jgi:hypothetical protein
MNEPLRYANDTYTRDPHGIWRYPWGAEVPGARDLTLGVARQLGLTDVAVDGRSLRDGPPSTNGSPSSPEHDVALGPEPVTVAQSDASPDVVIGMLAPELSAGLMLTVADISAAAGVTKATIDSYRYRGYLPEPQVVRARTPLWARPIIQHWIDGRPGCGWRTDVYGTRRQAVRRMPVTGNRRVNGHRAGR